MMSNRSVSLVDHYILDLSCDIKSKCFTGSITLFIQPVVTNIVLPSENKTPCEASLSTPNSQGAYLSQVKKRSASEQIPSLIISKTDGSAVSDPIVNLHNQQIPDPETDMGNSLKCALNKYQEELVTSKDEQSLLIQDTNVDITAFTTGDQKTNDFVSSREKFKTDLHSLSSYDELSTSITVDEKSPLIKEAISSSCSINLKKKYPQWTLNWMTAWGSFSRPIHCHWVKTTKKKLVTKLEFLMESEKCLTLRNFL